MQTRPPPPPAPTPGLPSVLEAPGSGCLDFRNQACQLCSMSYSGSDRRPGILSRGVNLSPLVGRRRRGGGDQDLDSQGEEDLEVADEIG